MHGADEGLDRVVRRQVYEHLLEGEAPTPAELANALNLPAAEIGASLQRLAGGRALVFDPSGTQLRMAMPLSAIPTEFRVECRGRTLWAPCAWDALGIPAMLGRPARIVTGCGDCGEEIVLQADARGAPAGSEVVHFAVPAARWWDDIFYT
jgi:hypothetical protein